MKEDTDMGNTDDTFQEVFRDFSNMASNNPEMLRRHYEQSENRDSTSNTSIDSVEPTRTDNETKQAENQT